MEMHIGVTKYCCFYVYGITTLGTAADHYEKHKKLICSWSEQCSGVQHPSLASHDKS